LILALVYIIMIILNIFWAVKMAKNRIKRNAYARAQKPAMGPMLRDSSHSSSMSRFVKEGIRCVRCDWGISDGCYVRFRDVCPICGSGIAYD